MLIGIDVNGDIKQIDEMTDSSLIVKEVDRDTTFPGFSDTRILNYRYIEAENSRCITPAKDLKEIERLELILENTELMYQLLTGEEL